MNEEAAKMKRQLDADIVVVGGGGSGLAAAVAATECGAKVIVIEKRSSPGGNSSYAEGLFAAESAVQKRLGIDARRDVLFRLAMEYAHWDINAGVFRAFIDKSGDTIKWLEEKGLKFAAIPPLYPSQSIRTWHSPEKGGAAVIQALINSCHRMGIRILYNTSAEKVLIDRSGKVTGVIASTKHSVVHIAAGSVIIATGGFGGNRRMINKHCHFLAEGVTLRGLPLMGEGIRMATEVGASTEGLSVTQLTSPYFPNSSMLLDVCREPDSLWVNSMGKRFTDESTAALPSESVNAIIRQPGMISYAIIDDSLVQKITRNGFTKVYLGVLYGQEIGGISGLEEELELQAKGLASVEQINNEKCNGCDICVNACPENTIKLDTIASDFDEHPACRTACPVGVDIRTYMHLFRSGQIDEAAKVLREYLPLPAITGRVCPHFCETECDRKGVDEPVNIKAVERLLADYSLKHKAKPIPKRYNKKVAIIGSGPAGLSAAFSLTRMGYPVTVFDQQDALGGMLRMGIPEYRLPEDVLDKEINYIKDMGTDFKTGVIIGKDITFGQIKKDFQAVLYATGNQLSRKIEIDGGRKTGVLQGLDFIKDANMKKDVKVYGKVVVIGGGNVAVDVALTALRLGAKEVEIACLETGNEMPAYREGIEQAIAEGVKINDGWGLKRIAGDGKKVSGIELVQCSSVYDNNGKFNPQYDNATIKIMRADMVILAVGQSPDFSLLPKEMKITLNNTIEVDDITLETSIKGVFAGGDNIDSAGSVIGALAAGKRAAESIDKYLRGEDMKKGRTKTQKKVHNPPCEGITKIPRNMFPVNSIPRFSGNFNEVKLGFDEETAIDEANRCMTCGSKAIITDIDVCRLCKTCQLHCPQNAISPVPIKKINPRVIKADSWDEVAEWIGCDAGVLKSTIDEYNDFCDHGYDSKFNKEHRFLNALRTPPYYALKFSVSLMVTMGGIRINENMEAVDESDKPCPGLYAVGCDAGGWESETYCAQLSGSTFGFAINSGRIAGENAARYINGK